MWVTNHDQQYFIIKHFKKTYYFKGSFGNYPCKKISCKCFISLPVKTFCYVCKINKFRGKIN